MTEFSAGKSWRRPLALVAAVLFSISWMFPMLAPVYRKTLRPCRNGGGGWI
jgi:hypothetical protein